MSGGGALSSLNSYMTIFVLADTTGAKQMRVVLLTIVQGDWEEKKTSVKGRMVRGKEELTATLLKMSWGFLATSRSVPMKTMFTPPLNSKRKSRNYVELDNAGDSLTHSLSLTLEW